ncbi:glycerophosphodiester phosphodiesterase family protein [Hyphobacterium sp.]|uniref:glycerophosphodiester phosphodiesterase family protein n=1 Tax=Hyphobacterium sp. TaxID=2004662 RepID=UPI003BA906F8
MATQPEQICFKPVPQRAPRIDAGPPAAMLSALILAGWFQVTTEPPSIPALLECARDADITLVSVHRAGGFAPGIPENSLAAFHEAARIGAAFVEVDLRETRDGEIILLHDLTLDRTTTGSGPVANSSLVELRSLILVDADGRRTHQRIPTMSDAFSTAGELNLYLHLDLNGLAPERIARLVLEAGMEHRTLIQVAQEDGAAIVQSLSRDIAILLPFSDRYEVLNSELDFDTLISWIGYGIPDARTQYFLGGQSIETAMHDLPGEQGGTIDYSYIDERNIELLVSSDPAAALSVFGRWDRYCPVD